MMPDTSGRFDDGLRDGRAAYLDEQPGLEHQVWLGQTATGLLTSYEEAMSKAFMKRLAAFPGKEPLYFYNARLHKLAHLIQVAHLYAATLMTPEGETQCTASFVRDDGDVLQ